MRSIILALAACGGGATPQDPAGDDDDAGPPPATLPPSSTLAFTDATNFAYDADATLPHVDLLPGADFLVDWSSLTRDLVGRPLDPTTVANAILSARTDSPAEIASGLADETLDDGPVQEGWNLLPLGRTSAQASEFLFDSHPFVPAEDLVAGRTLFVSLVTPEVQILSAGTATAGGTGTLLAIDDTARIDWTATLGAQALATTPDLGPWTIDWSGLAHDSRGRPVDPLAMEQLFLARVEVATDDEVVAALLDLEALAAEWYLKYVAGVASVDASELTTADGEDDFEGFTDAPGTWVVGLRCGSCATPVPAYAAVVRVQ